MITAIVCGSVCIHVPGPTPRITPLPRASLKIIARQLKISPSTVSRALSDHPDVSEETKQRVRRTAQKLEYIPDPIARSLKTQETKTIGVIVPQIRNFFFSAVISGIESHLRKQGYTLVVCQSDELEEREALSVKTLVSHRVAGILVSLSQMTKSLSHFDIATQRGIPVVFFDRTPDAPDVSRVVVDDEAGARSLVEHMITQGYKRIAHIGGPSYLAIAALRLRGFRAALVAHGIDPDCAVTFFRGLNEEDGVIGMQRLLDIDPRPDAVFCVTDPVAIGAFTVLKARALRIPADIALGGFANNPITALLDPPLTTVEQHPGLMGERAASILLQHIRHEGSPSPVTEILHNTLIIRSSTQL